MNELTDYFINMYGQASYPALFFFARNSFKITSLYEGGSGLAWTYMPEPHPCSTCSLFTLTHFSVVMAAA
jgi:hypothetical protein